MGIFLEQGADAFLITHMLLSVSAMQWNECSGRVRGGIGGGFQKDPWGIRLFWPIFMKEVEKTKNKWRLYAI